MAGVAGLEDELAQVSGVLSAVVFRDESGKAAEVQAFVEGAVPEDSVRRALAEVLASRDQPLADDEIFIFHLAGQAVPEGLVGARKFEATRRPKIGLMSLEEAGLDAEAKVSLVLGETEAQVWGRSRRTQYGLRVTAAATLEAAQTLIGSRGLLKLKGVSLVETLREKVVIALVHSSVNEGITVVGAALVGDGPIHEATVRAALDAINRQMELVFDR